MSSIISIPVSPLIMSLFEECKENLKYADKSNTDFLIFLLNSSMHIFSIVKEFSPILQDALGSTGTLENGASQLQELEKKSNGFLSPTKPTSTINTLHDIKTDQNGHCTSDDEISLASLTSPHKSPTQPPITESAISDHFANYSKPSNIHASSPNKPHHTCPKCAATFSFKQGLQRHLSKNSCDFHLGKKRKLSLLNSQPNSTTTNGKESSESESDSSDESDDDSIKITSSSFSGNLLCPDCGKGFVSIGNLNRHVKLSKVCGTVDFKDYESNDTKLSVSLPAKWSDDASRPAFECTFCKSVLSTEKTYNVHKRKFRCRRRCKFCEFTASQSIFVQSHLTKEHNLLLSVDEIEDYNKQLFLEHFNEPNLGPIKEGKQRLYCPVYQCKFSTTHKGGQTTHIRFHKAEVANSGEDVHDCETCDTFGIPDDKFEFHDCAKEASAVNESDSDAKENGALPSESLQANKPAKEETVSQKENSSKLVEEEKVPQKKSSPKKRSPVSLKLNKKTSPASGAMPSLLKLATNSTSPKKKANLSLKKKLSGKKGSPEDARLQCKFCDFVGASHRHVAGHMNVHKFKRARLSSNAT
ncbi:uncharacterized protein LOC134824912 [Bolinopsis microptera]|uniref:uncharacterized protein LOC134824912 n=1 Tax=Bolinopsis microptera TaxID=2820187 RepID=UPI003079AB7D